jgi:predicted DNA-binding protein
MKERELDELVERARGGEDISDRIVRTTTVSEPVFPAESEPEVLVGRSVRMSMDMYSRIELLAERRRTSVSALIRSLIETGLDAAEQSDDPETHLRRVIAEAQYALRQVQRLPRAA